jgi:hypothetical protein
MTDPVGSAGARIAWRGAMAAAALNVAGSLVELPLSRSIPNMPRWPSLFAAGTGLLLLALLARRRDRPTRLGAAVAFSANTAVILVELWITNIAWSSLGPRWAPFLANKLGALTVGLLTPEIGVGIANIAAYAGQAAAQWWRFPASLRAQLTKGEPWTTFIFAGFGLGLLVLSARRFAVERKLLQEQHEAIALERMVRLALAVRDFANTPLQTIASAAELLRLRRPETAGEVAIIERALARLQRLNRLVSRHESAIRWREGDEAFDAFERLGGSLRDDG